MNDRPRVRTWIIEIVQLALDALDQIDEISRRRPAGVHMFGNLVEVHAKPDQSGCLKRSGPFLLQCGGKGIAERAPPHELCCAQPEGGSLVFDLAALGSG
nr:hypothetical protein [Geminicoccus roseus]